MAAKNHVLVVKPKVDSRRKGSVKTPCSSILTAVIHLLLVLSFVCLTLEVSHYRLFPSKFAQLPGLFSLPSFLRAQGAGLAGYK